MKQALINLPARQDFSLTPIIDQNSAPKIGLDFSLMHLRTNDHFDLCSPNEHALLVLTGDVTFCFDDEKRRVVRRSVFDDAPFALHLCAGAQAKIIAHDDSELAVIATPNNSAFAHHLFDHKTMLENEHRGQGMLDDTAYRIVRTIFDKRNRPHSNLVLGEVITFPGRWSSYPPHHHAQPEIYHYRFTETQGYGHAELGEHVVKIRHGDTLCIVDNLTHSQVSAPGYGMYYLWAIRHLPNDPYTVPTFVDEHAWTKSAEANDRVWKCKNKL